MKCTRHDARLWAVQFLFQRDFNPGELEEALSDFWEERQAPGKLRAFAEMLIHGVEARIAEIDAFLQQYAENWDLKRMSGVDRNAMRVAVFEMLHCDDIPPVVSINEAVDIAKAFDGPQAGKFVNGLLDRIRKDIDRPARSPRNGS